MGVFIVERRLRRAVRARRALGSALICALVSSGLTAALTGGLVAGTVVPAAAHEGHDHAAQAQDQAQDQARAATGPTLPPGFSDVEVISGVSEAVSVAFAPDGTAFVALKTGQVKSFDQSGGTGYYESAATATDFADLRTPVDNYWDRGLTGITVDPTFGTGAGRDYVYVSYTYNKDPRGGSVPAWGDPTEAYDECAAPATTDPPTAGCPVMLRVTRLSAQRGTGGWVMVPGSEKELLSSGCFQFGSHASGDVVFGPDGKLYASAGEGASFDTLDHGQYADPCGDPDREGGSLRAQDYRTSGDPLGVDGSIVRIDPDRGLVPSQSTAGQWLVAYGQRNPWRLVFRPGTGQLWSGDVGASGFEEVNRLDDAPASTTPVNRGWPCYEGRAGGSLRNQGWDALDVPICEGLYAQGAGAVSAPYFSYVTRDGGTLTPGEDCLSSTSSVSGVAFTTGSTSYPAAYQGSLYFSDFARSCVWRLGKLANGEPDPSTIVPFVQAADTPVNLKTGPGGDLYYVDYGLLPNGAVDPGRAGVHRIVYSGTSNAAPTARITADRQSGDAPLSVTFDGRTSSDPDGDVLTYAWDLDGDGAYDDSTSATPRRTYAAGTTTVRLRVDDGQGHTATTSTQVQAGNTAPTLGTITPTDALSWKVGDRISFAGSATDAQDGTLPASALTWQLSIRHCPGGVCHSHGLETFPGVASGSFLAPDHEYPSHLLLTVTATDSGGLTATRTIQLDPRTVRLTWAGSPSGSPVTVNGASHTTPYSETFLQGSRLTMIAPDAYAGKAFSAWSDGGAAAHEVSAPSTPTTWTATYADLTASVVASPASGTAPLTTALTASVTPAGGSPTFAWDLDGDGSYDDATGPTTSATYTRAGGNPVAVRVTRGSVTATGSTTVTVQNSAPTIVSMAPTADAQWSVGQVLQLSASATDPQETLPAAAYRWTVQRQDCATGCARTTVADATGPSATITVPQLPLSSRLVVSLLVTDSEGQATGLTRELTPLSSTVDLATTPAGGAVTVDGTAGPTPRTLSVVRGSRLQVSAPAERTVDGETWAFAGWSDGGARTHTVTASAAASTLTARYAEPTEVPVAALAAATTTGVAPFTVTLDAGATTGSGALAYAWDLDGDGAFDDATGPTATSTYPVGTWPVSVRVTDARGAGSTSTTTVVATNTAPSVTRVTAYPEGGFSVGQTLGFDAAGVDAQQELPDAAFSFTVERQDCATCPRSVVQRWTGVQHGQYVVPQVPWGARLLLTATVTDAQGATGSRTVTLAPVPAALRVLTRGKGLRLLVGGTAVRGPAVGTWVAGSVVRLEAPKRQTRKGQRWRFVRWSDGQPRVHDVRVSAAGLTVKAVYERVGRTRRTR